MLIIRSMGNADNINNSAFINFFIPPPPLNDNFESLMDSIKVDITANTKLYIHNKMHILYVNYNDTLGNIVIPEEYAPTYSVHTCAIGNIDNIWQACLLTLNGRTLAARKIGTSSTALQADGTLIWFK